MDPSDIPQRPSRRTGNTLFLGLILVVVGSLFLLQQMGNFSFHNWWALFILIPAFGAFSTAWYAYRRNYQLNEGVRAGLGGGLITLTIALMFLFNLDWSLWWPLTIIMPGVVTFFNGFTLPESHEATRPLARHLYRPWFGWIGFAMIYLGLGFLLHNLGILSPASFSSKWWAIAILIPAVGGVITQFRLVVAGDGLRWAGISNLATTLIFGAVGLVALLGIGWNLLTPIILIAVGVVLIIGVINR
jgi:hypothetical protein